MNATTIGRAASLAAVTAVVAAAASIPAVAASNINAVQNLSAFKSACNTQTPGRTFGRWQETLVTRGASGTAVYADVVVGTYDTGYGLFRCVGILPTGRTAGKGYQLTVTALRADAEPDIAASASGSSDSKFVKIPTQIVQDGEDELSDLLVAVGTVDKYDMATPAASSVRLLP